ncbi:HD domain-containing phosphohydrolase [Blautia obeum]|uniref:Cyclic di-GMP phosphodiesterase response regulator RpfG n=1 Tax=Blautia obeum TaxID=40520 RepID=A0A564UNG4_9FIRM|nr:HD domain-containing phosphohydrolase [Blautia obeum]VUX20762.1 Cyclic di-GMP phosphodiesterase response regulator RpfG [Blautia obeum]
MDKNVYAVSRKKRYLFYILVILSLSLVGILQFTVKDESRGRISEESVTYKGEFIWKKADGNYEKIQVPGRYQVPAEETMTILTTLPLDYAENSLAIRSSLQNIRFYIDGELREEYDTSDTRLIGKNTASGYVFCTTSEADAGKEVRIELQSNTEKYSGVVNAVYCGDRTEIWEYLFQTYGMETVVASFLLFAGIITIVFSIALSIVYQMKFDMEYLGWCVLVAAVWMLGESKIRQLLVPNPTALSSLCFVMILLCPVPISYYVDTLQEGRHKKAFAVIEDLAFLNLIICSALHITGYADYIETLPIAQAAIGVTVFLVAATFIWDLRRGYRIDGYAAAGIIVALTAVVIETASVYFVVSISGVFIGSGMIILLILCLIRTIRNIWKMESNKQKKEMDKHREQLEEISLQLMQTLSTTIEAKDEYTRGHSYRVAEYSALIARELNWDEDEIRNLKNAAYLHDIGKIGIPDNILNKPVKLTDEELGVIKEHTVIGAEILKNITLIDHVKEAARSHHERYDGRGYPDGLKGEEIPLYARIIAVADSFDAMKSRRIYRSPLDDQVVYNEIFQNRGTQFDPELADIFLKLLDEERVITEKERELFDEDGTGLNMESEIEKFISSVMTTIKTQENIEGFDFLTGLPMRNRGEMLAAQFMQQDDGYLVFLDMDNLKKMNDLYGHKAGDRALKLLGSLLMEYTRHAVVCRLGGDEFLMFVPKVSKERITEIVTGIQKDFDAEKEKDPEIRFASVSAGICEVNKGDPFEECYSKADKALYHVKQNGKGSFFFYYQLEDEKVGDHGTGKDLELVSKALSASGDYYGALELDYREFAKIYEYMNSMEKRYKCHCYLVMVTLETEADSASNIEDIEFALECMEQAIRQKIRKVDVCTRYSSMQYLIILFEADEKRIPNIMERIFGQYREQCGKKNLLPNYDYMSMTEK